MNPLLLLSYGAPPLFALALVWIVRVSYVVSILATLIALYGRITGRTSSTASKVAIGFGTIPLLLSALGAFFIVDPGDFFLHPIVLSLIGLLAVAIATSFYFLRLERYRARAAEIASANKAAHRTG